ncbi:MAG TPA: M48 family metalloprotease [Fimbriimonadaceae bacterium]|nr:M48 family metalloprotease [Fimbriimonadaceae bacterium]
MYVEDRGRLGWQVAIAIVIAVGALAGYASIDHGTGGKQRLDMSVDQEIALGRQAASRMVARFGGEDPDKAARQYVAEIGKDVVSRSDAKKSGYKFQFHDLADEQTVDAFALPGGQVFVTRGLLTKLTSSGQLAAVLGHECGHVLAHDGTEQMAENSLVEPKFSREDELEADKVGIRLMSEAGFDPRSMIEVVEILRRSGSGGREPAFFSTHPDPDNREEAIRREIAARFPNGIPYGLTR